MSSKSETPPVAADASSLIAPVAFEPMAPGQLEDAKAPPYRLIALVAVLLIAALAIGFLLTARSVAFETAVAGAEIDIDGGLHLAVGARYLLRPGEYRLRISHPEYNTLNTSVSIGEEAQQSHSFELQRKPDLYSIRTQPQQVEVFVDGQSRGHSPLKELQIAAGERQLRLQHPRYLPLEQTLAVAGGGYPREFEASLQPAWARLTIASEPSGASLYSGDKHLGETPIDAEVIQGRREIRLELQGHKTWTQALDVEAGVDQDLATIELQPADARVALDSTPSDAGVLLDGSYKGQTPLLLELQPGTEHRIELFKQGYRKTSRRVQYASGIEEELRLSLQAEIGELQLQIQTAGARLQINGRQYPAESATLKLAAVPQTIRVSKAGYLPFETRITPRPGFKQRLDIKLLTAAQARAATIKPVYQTAAGQTMRLLKPAAFTMGASRREAGRRANEVIRKVSLNRPFYLSSHEISNAQYRLYLRNHSSRRVEDKSLNSDQQPVVRVRWRDAALYCNWLSEKEGLPLVYQFDGEEYAGADRKATGYRLPTEAEWAWSARVLGSTNLKFPWGQEWPISPGSGNFGDASASAILARVLPYYQDGFAAAAPIGRFQPNHNQLYDMGGNVAEWVHDYYTPGKPPAQEADPFGPEKSAYHVVRGSSWRHSSQVELRLSYRDYSDQARDDLGFRIARYLE